MNDRIICVLNKEDYSAKTLDLYKQAGKITDSPHEATVLVTGVSPIDCSLLPNLQTIVTNVTDTHHIKNPGNVKIVSLKDHKASLNTVTSTGELTILLLMSLMRKVDCDYSKHRKFYMGTKLAGKTALIIGYGRIGHYVARALEGMGVYTYSCDTDMREEEKHRIIKNSEIVIVTASDLGIPALFPRDIDEMWDDTYLVNTSRGHLIPEDYLLADADRFAGIALDVLNGEPNPPNLAAWKAKKNVIITPHIGGMTKEDYEFTQNFIAKEFLCTLGQ